MKYPIIKLSHEKEFEVFVNYWSNLYYYEFSDKYDSRILKKKFSAEDLSELYIWKNGMRLSDAKSMSFKKNILSKLKTINKYKNSSDFKIIEFLKEFDNVSFVWKIFLLHLINPDKYPIYDQHIHRSFLYLNDLNWLNIGANLHANQKSDFYFNSYLPFIKEQNKIKIKMIDEAMFTFGKFINTENQHKILIPK
jgi:hypothetical protein